MASFTDHFEDFCLAIRLSRTCCSYSRPWGNTYEAGEQSAPHSTLSLSLHSHGTFCLPFRHTKMAKPQEPPVVATPIPYIGHIIGLMRSKFNYYVQLR